MREVVGSERASCSLPPADPASGCHGLPCSLGPGPWGGCGEGTETGAEVEAGSWTWQQECGWGDISVTGRQLGGSPILSSLWATRLPASHQLPCWLVTEPGVWLEMPQLGVGIRALWQAGPVTSSYQVFSGAITHAQPTSQNCSDGKEMMCVKVLWKARHDHYNLCLCNDVIWVLHTFLSVRARHRGKILL